MFLFTSNCKQHGQSYVLGFLLLANLLLFSSKTVAAWRVFNFIVEEANYTRLCTQKSILTVNGQYPGPSLTVQKGERVFVNVFNNGTQNITIHWHGVKQPRNPWSDGPEYVTQCPLQPGRSFMYRVIFSNEEGSLWWHAHSDWSRATVHGAIIVNPQNGTNYPFPTPFAEETIILGEWWNMDVQEVLQLAIQTGGEANISDAFTINGQPGDLYNCSELDTFTLTVQQGQTYLLHIINAAMSEVLFFSIENHPITIVAIDASYTKPLTRDYIMIGPGQTMDVLLAANQAANKRYYMAAKAYSTGQGVTFNNTTTTAILQYLANFNTTDNSSAPSLPNLPDFNDTQALFNFITGPRSLASNDHPISVPTNISHNMLTTVSVNTFPCLNTSCAGPNGTRLAASLNNISFVLPSIDILQAYYSNINGVYRDSFPDADAPPLFFNFTGDFLPLSLLTPRADTEVRILDYNSTVELVFQGTSLVAGEDHPLHLHGYSFYVVGYGLGNFDAQNDPPGYNLADPPYQSTIMVPKNGWVAVRFRADNPGVWFMHCHFDRHQTWGMNTVFIVQNGTQQSACMLSRPANMPPC